jgi:hypothetical protein
VQYVSCPLHKRNFTLTQGDCLNDSDYHILAFDAREASDGTGGIQLHLPPVNEIDGILGTEKWLVRQAQSEALGLKSCGAGLTEWQGESGNSRLSCPRRTRDGGAIAPYKYKFEDQIRVLQVASTSAGAELLGVRSRA